MTRESQNTQSLGVRFRAVLTEGGAAGMASIGF
jgi:hypothetical protein